MSMMKDQKTKKFGIVKEVLVEYYFEIEAKSMRGAKQKARNMEAEGNLSSNSTGYNWIEVQTITVYDSEEWAKSRAESVGEEI